MRLSIVTFGSEGDTRPLAALCRGLVDQGHQPTLFAEHSTLDLPRRLGIPCVALSGDVRSILPLADPRQDLRIADVVKSIKATNALIATNTPSWVRTVAEHAREADAIAFSSLAVGLGAALSEQLGKPAVGLFFQPVTATREFSSPMVPPMNLPGWLKRQTFRLTHRHMWSAYGKPAQLACTEMFGRSANRQRFEFDHAMLYGVSSELVPQPQDWPQQHQICGHWAHDAHADWQPPPALQEFLQQGEAPLYAGFGSPSAFIRSKELTALIGGVAGRRVIFSPGWSQIDSSVLPSNFLIARDVPHEWLFPQVSAVIHHGGAGTTHTAARAGVPQIVLPIGGDHHFWASRVVARGIAPRAGRGDRHNAKAITAMIEFTMREEVRHKARQLGDAMSREDGVTTAIRAMERVVH
jgi:UDP:flavonoid glycosyltransferase YjiC (YdhE family)